MSQSVATGKGFLAWITLILPILGATLAWGLPTLWSTVVAPKFDISLDSDYSTVNVTNVGGTAAHHVRLTLVVPNNQTGFFGFSSENITWSHSYDTRRNQSAIFATLQRFGEQAMLKVRFDRPPNRVDLWISSDEIGGFMPDSKGKFDIPSTDLTLWLVLLYGIAIPIDIVFYRWLRKRRPKRVSVEY